MRFTGRPFEGQMLLLRLRNWNPRLCHSIAITLEAIAIRLEAIAIGILVLTTPPNSGALEIHLHHRLSTLDRSVRKPTSPRTT